MYTGQRPSAAAKAKIAVVNEAAFVDKPAPVNLKLR